MHALNLEILISQARNREAYGLSTVYRVQLKRWHGYEYLRGLTKKRTEPLRVKTLNPKP